MEKVIIYSVKK